VPRTETHSSATIETAVAGEIFCSINRVDKFHIISLTVNASSISAAILLLEETIEGLQEDLAKLKNS
jgi:hypothetical protein